MMQIRCLFSVRNSSDQWDLSCLVREKMVEFIRANYPEAFPRTRFSAVAEFAASADDGRSPGMAGRTASRDPQHMSRKSA